jgi:hypothetical protein
LPPPARAKLKLIPPDMPETPADDPGPLRFGLSARLRGIFRCVSCQADGGLDVPLCFGSASTKGVHAKDQTLAEQSGRASSVTHFAHLVFLFFLLARKACHWRTQLIVTWDAYALCFLTLAWTRILTAVPRVAVRLTRLQPTSRKPIFVFVVAPVCASLASVACSAWRKE